MRTTYRGFIFILLFILSVPVNTEATTKYNDHYGVFSFSVPSGWVYQVSESNNDILVFYGPSEYELFYVEYFSRGDLTVEDFAKQVLKVYGADYGLPSFMLLEEPVSSFLAGLPVIVATYSFDGKSIPRTEQRVFLVYEDMAVTVTFSDIAHRYDEHKEQFNLMLTSWSYAGGD